MWFGDLAQFFSVTVGVAVATSLLAAVIYDRLTAPRLSVLSFSEGPPITF